MILASQEMIKEWTEKGAWGTKTLIDYFKENVDKYPDEVCIVDPFNKEELMGFKPERLTYREFDRAVDATAEGFLKMGIQKDDVIVVQIPNCWELAMLYLAITRAGALISPMPMQWRASEFEYIARLTEAKAFITVEEYHGFKHREMGERLQSKLPDLKHLITLPEIIKMSKGDVTGKLDSIPLDANDIFTLCWTSGTEAQPKGCPLSHNNWVIQAKIQIEATGMNHQDNFLTAGPLVNMASVGTVFIQWLLLGNKLVLHHPFNPLLLVEQLKQEKITYTLLVPAVVNMLLKHPKADEFDLSSLRMITIGSAPPSLWSVQELKKRWGIDFANIWGQNEGTAVVSGPFDVPDVEKRIYYFPQWGKPGAKWHSPTTQFIRTKIVDPATGEKLTEVGSVGQLMYRGPNVIPCYFKNPDATEKSFDKDGFFNTGDLFEIKENGCIGFFDRAKDIIIRGGFNISAQEIENMLLGYPDVADVAAVAMPDERLGEKVCVYVVPKEGRKITLDDLTTFMKEKGIATYKLPERLEIIDAIPRNPVGKILKKELREDIKKKLESEKGL
ncbi:MAG: (2,3-dihydroxybenzoyl)adenylate synthase [Deltaproteobacteria bacterium]|nr:MAG: (2,3-dihydroxybenzoyl)adenylate synthase [Deltaproteobacteria bacterium]